MNWYLSKLVFRIICGDGNHTAQFDEQLRLIAAVGKEEAFEKAIIMGKEGEDSFVNDRKELVRWQFINISELYQLNQLGDGAEIYSRIEEQESADVYIYTVNQKAESIFLSQTDQQLLQPA